ncbi:hypothetical protein WMY93_030213 [Mugilogobius chulae]|uniref:Carboxypeptidase activation peptide domain-containing protein n=1 Tax=Mugilogobius chulae TaxID=88201 RepID=A0AAW0MVD0_9GOBI
MKFLLLLGLVAVALANTRFDGEKVFRLKPVIDEHVTLIKELADSMELDFWRPESPQLVTIDIDVDIRVPLNTWTWSTPNWIRATWSTKFSLKIWKKLCNMSVVLPQSPQLHQIQHLGHC